MFAELGIISPERGLVSYKLCTIVYMYIEPLIKVHPCVHIIDRRIPTLEYYVSLYW